MIDFIYQHGPDSGCDHNVYTECAHNNGLLFPSIITFTGTDYTLCVINDAYDFWKEAPVSTLCNCQTEIVVELRFWTVFGMGLFALSGFLVIRQVSFLILIKRKSELVKQSLFTAV